LKIIETGPSKTHVLSFIPQKNEVVQKDTRSEDGSRNLNGRLYKDRTPDQHPASGSDPVLGRGTMRLIGTFLLALLVLLTAMAESRPTTLFCHTKGGRQKNAKEMSLNGQKDKGKEANDGQAEKWSQFWERSARSWRWAALAE